MRIFVSLLFLFCAVLIVAQSERKVAVLDMTQINGETNLSRYYSVEQMMDLVGVPYDTTSELSVALNYPVVITASRIAQDAFTAIERNQIETFVNNGGVLITSNLRDTNFRLICGIDSIISDNEVYTITWDTVNYSTPFEMLDDSMEVTISLGRVSSGPTFYSRTFTTGTGVSMGEFENGKSALVYNQLGQGHVYTFGPDFRDLIYRPRIDQDVNAHRIYSNGFEPSSDVIAMIIRNLVGKHVSNTVYKYTVPGKSSSVLCLTHDIDSRTAVDTMMSFVDAEVDRGITAHYNITVRYLSDGWMTNFYIGAHQEIAYVRDQGHVLASHSVGHFPDFEDDNVFPYGVLGNTPASYQPVYFSGMTIGGSVLGETEVSKALLEDDFNVSIRSWRSGHLAYPDSLGLALEELGYEFSSTYSSNNILTNFPFYTILDGSFSGHPGNVLEIPMTISDVFASDPITENNYMDKVAIWSDVNKRYDRNNSSLVLLVHPNRGWKLTAQEAFLDSLLPTQAVVSFEDYGEFWRKRDSLNFHTLLLNNDTEMEVHMDGELGEDQSFVIDTLGLAQVTFYDEFGVIVDFTSQTFKGSQKLFYQEVSDVGLLEYEALVLSVYPNPTSGNLTLQCSEVIEEVTVFELSGKVIPFSSDYQNDRLELKFDNSISNGVYILMVKGGGKIAYQKIILERD